MQYLTHRIEWQLIAAAVLAAVLAGCPATTTQTPSSGSAPMVEGKAVGKPVSGPTGTGLLDLNGVTLPDAIELDRGFVRLSFREAAKLSSDRESNLLIYFYTEWCGPCKELDKKVFVERAFQEFAAGLVSVQVDANSDEGQQVAKYYGVKSYPTMIVCEAGGKEIERFFGYSPTEKFVQTVKDYMVYRHTATDYKERAAKAPDDLALSFVAGRELAVRKRGLEAIPFLERVIEKDKDNMTGHVPRAMLLLGKTVYLDNLKDQVKALPVLEQLSQRFPDAYHGTEATYMIARIYLEKGNRDMAKDVLTNRVKLNPEDAIQYFRFGTFCLRYNFMLEEGAAKLMEGAELHPKAGYLWKTVGDVYFRLKDYDNAVSAMEQALVLKPSSKAYQRILETFKNAQQRQEGHK